LPGVGAEAAADIGAGKEFSLKEDWEGQRERAHSCRGGGNTQSSSASSGRSL
jgi:hypothetical protein